MVVERFRSRTLSVEWPTNLQGLPAHITSLQVANTFFLYHGVICNSICSIDGSSSGTSNGASAIGRGSGGDGACLYSRSHWGIREASVLSLCNMFFYLCYLLLLHQTCITLLLYMHVVSLFYFNQYIVVPMMVGSVCKRRSLLLLTGSISKFTTHAHTQGLLVFNYTQQCRCCQESFHIHILYLCLHFNQLQTFSSNYLFIYLSFFLNIFNNCFIEKLLLFIKKTINNDNFN